jgi:VCBS repeat-containing protein
MLSRDPTEPGLAGQELIPPERPEPGRVIIGDAHLLFTGKFTRVGQDLVLEGEGKRSIVRDYFLTDHPAELASPDGAVLSADTVKALAGPLAPGQSAQAGGGLAGAVIGRVETVTGVVEVVRNGVAVLLNIGDAVMQGDVVQTSRDGNLAIRFIDGSVFQLAASGRMVLNDMVFGGGGPAHMLFSLVQGSLSFIAGEIAKTGDMKVDTPPATLGIRGTAVHADLTATDGRARYAVLREQDGRVGAFQILEKSTGRVLATADRADLVYIVWASGQGQTQVETVQKTSVFFPGEGATMNLLSGIAGITPSAPTTTPNQPGDDKNDPSAANPTRSGTRGSSSPPPDSSTSDLFQQATTNTAAPVLTEVVNTNPVSSPDTSITPQASTTEITPATTSVLKAELVLVSLPDKLPPGVNAQTIAAKLTVDETTGEVTFDKSGFGFLAQGEKVVYQVRFKDTATNQYVQTTDGAVNGENEAPVVASASATAVIDAATPDHSSVSGRLTFVDTDYNDTHTVQTVATDGAKGKLTVVLTEPGTTGEGMLDWTYVPDADRLAALKEGETMTETFTVIVRDGHGGEGTQTITITLKGVNDAPVGVEDSYTVAEDGTLTVTTQGLLSNDRDPDGDPLSVSISTGPSHGTLQSDGKGGYEYKPDADYHGQDFFTYVAHDGTTNSQPVKVTLNVTSVNDAPIARDDSYYMNDDTAFRFDGSVLANDTDADGDGLTAIIKSGPSHGTLAMNRDGTFTYTPDAQFSGIDEFTYVASDGSAQSDPATVKIVVPDLGFERGGSTWSSLGSVATLSSLPGVKPTEGSRFMALSSGEEGETGPVGYEQLEKFLGLAAGSLQALTDGASTDGSVTTIKLHLRKGDTVKFDWRFASTDSDPFDDTAFFTADGQVTKLASIADLAGAHDTKWQSHSYVATHDGDYDLGFGILDTIDNARSSFLYLDHLQVIST